MPDEGEIALFAVFNWDKAIKINVGKMNVVFTLVKTVEKYE